MHQNLCDTRWFCFCVKGDEDVLGSSDVWVWVCVMTNPSPARLWLLVPGEPQRSVHPSGAAVLKLERWESLEASPSSQDHPAPSAAL